MEPYVEVGLLLCTQVTPGIYCTAYMGHRQIVFHYGCKNLFILNIHPPVLLSKFGLQQSN